MPTSSVARRLGVLREVGGGDQGCQGLGSQERKGTVTSEKDGGIKKKKKKNNCNLALALDCKAGNIVRAIWNGLSCALVPGAPDGGMNGRFLSHNTQFMGTQPTTLA